MNAFRNMCVEPNTRKTLFIPPCTRSLNLTLITSVNCIILAYSSSQRTKHITCPKLIRVRNNNIEMNRCSEMLRCSDFSVALCFTAK
jgi:hypothetical protein